MEVGTHDFEHPAPDFRPRAPASSEDQGKVAVRRFYGLRELRLRHIPRRKRAQNHVGTDRNVWAVFHLRGSNIARLLDFVNRKVKK